MIKGVVHSKAEKGRQILQQKRIDTLLSKRLSAENKAKLSRLTSADFVTIAKLTH